MENDVNMNKGRQDHGTMIVLGLQKELRSIGPISGKEKIYARLKNERVYLKFEICVGNNYGHTSCKNLRVEEDS